MALVVIGGVAAGLSAAARARRVRSAPRNRRPGKRPGDFLRRVRLALLRGRPRAHAERADRLHSRVFPQGAQHRRAHRRARGVDLPRAARSRARIRRARALRAPGASPPARAATPAALRARAAACLHLHTLDDAARLRSFLREKQPRPGGGDRRGIHRPGSRRRAAPQRPRASPCWSARSNALLRDDAASPWRCGRCWKQHRSGAALRIAVGVASRRTAWRAFRATWWCWPPGFRPNVELAAEAGVEDRTHRRHPHR